MKRHIEATRATSSSGGEICGCECVVFGYVFGWMLSRLSLSGVRSSPRHVAHACTTTQCQEGPHFAVITLELTTHGARLSIELIYGRGGETVRLSGHLCGTTFVREESIDVRAG